MRRKVDRLSLSAPHVFASAAQSLRVSFPLQRAGRSGRRDVSGLVRCMHRRRRHAKRTSTVEQLHGGIAERMPAIAGDIVGGVRFGPRRAWGQHEGRPGCGITNLGTKVKFRLEGSGWQWTQFRKRFAEGPSVTIDLCTGTIRSGIGHTAPGMMGAPGVGETRESTVELQPGGVMVFGPQAASHGMTINAEVSKGSARMLLMCNDQAQATAKAFLDGRDLPRGSVLASRDVRGKATLRTGAAHCSVSLVATVAPEASESVTLSWRRPAAEAATSSGGPLIDCPLAAPAKAPRANPSH